VAQRALRSLALVAFATGCAVPAPEPDPPAEPIASAPLPVPAREAGDKRTHSAPAFDPELLVVAARSKPDAPADLVIVRSDGSVSRALTSTPDRHEMYPRWSPDHSQVAFVAEGNLFVVDADGTNERLLALGVRDAPPSWSPDGSRVLYLHPMTPCAAQWSERCSEKCVSDLHAVRVADRHHQALGLPVTHWKVAYEPTWVPDGRVVYRADCVNSTGEPELIGIDNLTVLPGNQLAFTRDASAFAFVRTAPERTAAYSSFRYAVEGALQVCDLGASKVSCAEVLSEMNAFSPRFATSADRIAFLRADGVWTMPRDGASSPRRIIETPRPAGVDW
jgi:hypothetical protein